MTDTNPFAPVADPDRSFGGGETEPTELRVSLSGKTGGGYEAGLINISGSVADVAAFLKLDVEDATFKASPFAAIVGTWNRGHVWAQKDYKSAGGPGKA